ncbi:MAG: hypothetical protein GY838_18370 [bacterium]|nr:hypothetical protein [bacterium]
MVLSGCGGEEESARDQSTPAVTAAADGCAVTVDAEGWTAFVDLAGRIAGDDPVQRDELGGLGADPAWERWRASRDEPIDLRRVANWLEATFWTELGRTGTQKQHPARRLYAESWRWSWEHQDLITPRIAETRSDAAELSTLVERWISPDRRPRAVTLTILPTLPEFRLVDDEYFIDVGFLAATPRDRLVGELIGLMFRNREFIPGEDPRTAAGAAAVAHTFRAMRNEGTAHWLEDTPHAHFFHDHPTFGDADVITVKYWEQALRAMVILDTELPAMWEDPERLADGGRGLMTALNTIQSDRNLGYAMAATIAANLGQERLHQASGSVPGFVAAFQEAAALNAVPAPTLQDCGDDFHKATRPFSDEAWAGLQDLLAEFFPG